MKTGKIEANLASLNTEFKLPYIQDLINQKITSAEKSVLKEIDREFHTQEYQRLQNELEVAFKDSHLPDEPSARAELNNLLIASRD